jgi:hypothetical protein
MLLVWRQELSLFRNMAHSSSKFTNEKIVTKRNYGQVGWD